MPSMNEDLGRIAGGIALSRRERMEANVERQREADSRHRAVADRLHEIKTTRETMGREQRKDAAAGRRSRMTDVEVLLRRLHRNRDESAAAERVRAAAFMRDLTGQVASLRDASRASQEARAKSHHDLAKELHERLAGYRQDRHKASAAWHATLARHAPSPDPVGAGRPAAERYTARAETSHAQPAAIEPAAPAPAAAEPASRPSRYRAPQSAPDEQAGTP